MGIAVIMPKQGQSVESCILTKWFKKKGETVKAGEVLFSYETDKSSFEEEAKADGVLLECFFQEGDEVVVLFNVAVIGNPGDSIDEFRPSNILESSGNVIETAPKTNESQKPDLIETVQSKVQLIQSDNNDEVFISPRAKKLAQKLGVPFNKIKGSGPNGRIIETDVENYAKNQPLLTPLAQEIVKQENLQIPANQTTGTRVRSFDLVMPNASYPEEFEVKKISNIRKLIAQKMHESLQSTAQLTHHLSADARKMLSLRAKFKSEFEKGNSENITINDLVCFAVIKALKKHPNVNIHFLNDSIRTFSKVHLGLAVDTERGLMVPVIRNADDLSIQGLSSQIKSLANSCKKGSIQPELIASESGTFTISNLGMYGIEMFTPVLNIPQVGILGVNTIINRPADLGGGAFGFVPVIGLSLTYDHRALDGAPASAFLKTIKDEIESLNC